MKYAFMEKHRSVWPVRWMSQALSVSASGFYDWAARSESGQAQEERAFEAICSVTLTAPLFPIF